MNFRSPALYAAAILSRSKILENLETIRRLDSGSEQALNIHQEEKLAKLLTHAHGSVPYYRDILEQSGVVKKGRVHLDGFSNLPVLTKDILRNSFEELRSRAPGSQKSIANASGGSTGVPVKFLQDRFYSDWNYANKIYYKTFSGQRPGDKELRLWGSARDLSRGNLNLASRVTNFLYNRKEQSAFKMEPADLRELVKMWNGFRPSWVEAYVDVVDEFAKYVEARGVVVHSPRGILTSTGTLYPEIRDRVKRVFGAEVYNRYGSREVGDMACNCELERGMHLSPWNHYFEILDDSLLPVGPGEMGRVFVTTLNNFTMPLLRYDIGDFAWRAKTERESCACGRTSKVIEMVEGREMSVLKKRSGGFVPGQYFIHCLAVVLDGGHIRKFQIIQRDFEDVLIKVVVADAGGFKSSKSEIEKITREVMGNDCRISFETVDDIPPLRSGKYLYTVCEI